MLIYTIIIGIAVSIITMLNYFIAIPICGYNYTIIQCFGMLGISVLVVFLIDAFLAFVIRRLPSRWFDFRKKFFHIFKWEKNFYEKQKIKKWKDKIPELGQFTNFSKSKIEDPTNNEYIERFLLEICYGEVIHFTSIILGFVIIFIFDLRYCWCMGLIVAIANGIINYLSFAILRYNRPKLTTIHKRNERLKQRNRIQ